MFRTLQLASRLAPQATRATSRLPSAFPASFRLRATPLLATQAMSSSSINRKDEAPPPKAEIDYKHEKEVAARILKPAPEGVTEDSSTRRTIETQATTGAPEGNFGGGLKHDIGIVADTFRLSSVPRESQVLGLLGTVPYLGTSCATLYLAMDLHQSGPTGSWTDSLLVSHDTAQYLLGVIEPLQLGYGAVIISFLGAIHWGLEYAEKQPSRTRTRFRYGMGLAASIVAWPTVLMPLEYALTTQFMAFVGLYFADAKASARGWAPSWYTPYRFMLTAIVGAAILISLVGRARIGQADHATAKAITANVEQSGLADHKTDWVALEAEEKKRIKKEEEEKKKKAKKEAEEKKKAGKNKSEKKGGKEDGKGASKNDDDDEEEEEEEKSDEKSDEDKKEGKDEEEQSDDSDKSDKNEEKSDKDEDESDKDEDKSDNDGQDSKEAENKSEDDQSKSKDDQDKSDDKSDSGDKEGGSKDDSEKEDDQGKDSDKKAEEKKSSKAKDSKNDDGEKKSKK